jgi:hypothetical protein
LDMPSKGLKHWPWRRRFLTKEETQWQAIQSL